MTICRDLEVALFSFFLLLLLFLTVWHTCIGLLLLLAEAAYSRTFATFASNCDAERADLAEDALDAARAVEEVHGTDEANGNETRHGQLFSSSFLSTGAHVPAACVWKHVQFCRDLYTNPLYLGEATISEEERYRHQSSALWPNSSVACLTPWRSLVLGAAARCVTSFRSGKVSLSTSSPSLHVPLNPGSREREALLEAEVVRQRAEILALQNQLLLASGSSRDVAAGDKSSGK